MNLGKIFKRVVKGIAIMLLGVLITSVGGCIDGNEIVSDAIMLAGVCTSIGGFIRIFKDED